MLSRDSDQIAHMRSARQMFQKSPLNFPDNSNMQSYL